MRSSATWKLAPIVTWFWTPPSTRLIDISTLSGPSEQKRLFAPPKITLPNQLANIRLGWPTTLGIASIHSEHAKIRKLLFLRVMTGNYTIFERAEESLLVLVLMKHSFCPC